MFISGVDIKALFRNISKSPHLKHERYISEIWLFAALSKAEPLISTTAHQKLDLDI